MRACRRLRRPKRGIAAALVLAAKGGVLADVTVGDVVELLDAQARVLVDAPSHGTLFYRLLRSLGIFGTDAPATLRALRTRGQRSPEQLIDRYGLACRPIRDLLVDYLRERQPALDYTSLVALSYHLGKQFWADLERHHPGIDSLHLPRGVADDWKRRLGTMTTTSRTESGETVARTVPRINYRECLTPVRAFYLDLAQWAVEDPGRWARWVAPCPVGAEEINRKKAKRQLKSRMDARTRERLPVLPVLVRSVNDHRRRTAELLEAARRTEPEATFAVAGQTLVRSVVARGEPGKVWAHDPATGRRRDLTRGRPRVLGLGRRRGAAGHRDQGRRTHRTQPSQPGPVPAADHRRPRAAAADPALQDRCGTAARGEPGTRRCPRHDHQPRPERLRRRARRRGL